MATDANGVVLGPKPAGVPHFLVPFAITATGSAQTVQQGTTQEVVQSVAMLVGTRPGTRYMLPTYGMTDPTFLGVNAAALQLAASTWEGRAAVSVASVPGNEETVTVSVGLAPTAPV